jgi:hypothetical protein
MCGDKGEVAFRDLCRHAMPLSDYLFETLRAQTDMSSQEGRVRLLTLMEPIWRRCVSRRCWCAPCVPAWAI